MALQLQASITFREEEYRLWFCSGKSNVLVSDLRKELMRRGVPSKNINKIKHCDIENFVFKSIIRKTAPHALFVIYKRLVQELSYDYVKAYVSNRRYHKDVVAYGYNPFVVGIILSDSKNKETDDAIQSMNIKKYIIKGKEIIESDLTFDHLCSCALTYDLHVLCSCCRHYMMLFANECIIHLGQDLFIQQFYNYLLFAYHFKGILITDVIHYIGLILIDII